MAGAAGSDRPAIKRLWHAHTASVLDDLDASGFASFEHARQRLETTLWPETLKLFPDLAERLSAIDPIDMLQKTLQSGVMDEYGIPALDDASDSKTVEIKLGDYANDSNVCLTFPKIVVYDKAFAYVINADW